MRKFGLILTLFFWPGCAWLGLDSPFSDSTTKPPSGVKAQYQAAQKAFQVKLDAAVGLPLSELRSQWGQVRQGFTRNDVSIYHWRRTLTVTPPPPRVAAELDLDIEAGKPTMPLSCLAVFIFQGGRVVEASCEGRCLEPNLMPAWKPEVNRAGG